MSLGSQRGLVRQAEEHVRELSDRLLFGNEAQCLSATFTAALEAGVYMIDIESGMGKSTNSSVCHVSGEHNLCHDI